MTRRAGLAVLFACAVATACAAPPPSVPTSDAGVPPRDTGPDTDPYCHWDCFGGFGCIDGVVVQYAFAPIPCTMWAGECPHTPADVTCVRGCREHYAAETAGGVCDENIPRNVGDPCSTDADCGPGAWVDDGFGHQVLVPLHCDVAASSCVRTALEVCNGDDDDDDRLVDEDCPRHPAELASLACGRYVADAAFGGDRIAVLCIDSPSTEDAFVAVLDPSGHELARANVHGGVRVERVDGGFASLGSTSIVRIGDDDVVTTIPVALGLVRFALLVQLGADYLVLSTLDATTGDLRVFDHATGALLRTGTFGGGLTALAGPHGHLTDGSVLLLSDYLLMSVDAYRIDATLSVSTLSMGDTSRVGPTSQIVTSGGALTVLVGGEFRYPHLASIDAATGAWTTLGDTLPVPGANAYALAAEGSDWVVSWMDMDTLRTVVLDGSLTNIAQTERTIALASGFLWSGPTSGGTRIVAAFDHGATLVAPALR